MINPHAQYRFAVIISSIVRSGADEVPMAPAGAYASGRPIRRRTNVGYELSACHEKQRNVQARLASNSSTRARRNGSASVTTPTVWWLPRSASLVTVAGLMSTHATLTQAGKRLPTAI